MSGAIAESVSELTALTSLVVSENALGGALPEGLGSLTALQQLAAVSNAFTALPTTLATDRSLHP